MNNGTKFILKIFTIILGSIVVIFLILFFKNLYDIKTGKLQIGDFTQAVKAKTEINDIDLDYKKLTVGDFPSFGSNEPKLTIVEFGSFSCPYSKQAAHITRKLMLKYKNDVKFIYRSFPIDDLYPDSSVKALAGKCANTQDKFWAFHDRMFSDQNINYYESALQSGLNEKEFTQCIQSQTYAQAILKDLKDGLDSGVRGTPTFFFIKKGFEDKPEPIEGVIPENILDEIINKLITQ